MVKKKFCTDLRIKFIDLTFSDRIDLRVYIKNF